MTIGAPIRFVRVVVVLSAVAASAALGWFAAQRTEDAVSTLVNRIVPAAGLSGLVLGLAVGAANKWGARSNDDNTACVGYRLEPLLCAPVVGLAFAATSALRTDWEVGLASQMLATWVMAAVIALIPSFIGVGLGTLAGQVIGPQPKR